MTIDWEYPEAGGGFDRVVAELIGPGATRAEIALVFCIGILAGISQIVYQLFAGLGWDIIQLAIATFMAFDIAGGVAANSTSTAKRWYHREEKGKKDHIGFVLIHGIYILLVTVFFNSFDWIFFTLVYGYLILTSVMVVMMPLYLRRPTSVTLFAGGLLMNIYILTPIPGLEWFVPMLYLKLIIGHIVQEEPYRPS
jgi:hypothetical protein